MKQKIVFLGGIILTALCGGAVSVAAQSATAALSGTVTDERGAIIAAAVVTITDTARASKRQATSNGGGFFTFAQLAPSVYTIKAERSGFAAAEIKDFTLNVGDRRSLPIILRAAGVAATVTVESESSAVDESPAVATTINRQFAENLPLNGRSFQSLINLAPGVVVTRSNSGNSVSSVGQFSVNGQRPNANYFTVDGVSANIGISTTSSGFGSSASGNQPGLSAAGGTNSLVSTEALQEFRIQTSTYAPEFGRYPGAQVQIVTRSGTNRFSGSVFDYFRNDALDANDWFANRAGLPRPALRQNDFGAVLGGPVFLPRFGEGGSPVYNGRDKTFFFFSYEGLRLRQPQTSVTSVPSLAIRAAAPAGLRPFLNAYPLPNGADLRNAAGQLTGAAQFTASYASPSNLDAASLRLDHSFSDRLTIFGRFNVAPSNALIRGTSAFGLAASPNTISDVNSEIKTFTAGSTQVLSARATNDFRFNLSRTTSGTNIYLDDLGGATVPNPADIFPSFASPASGYVSFNPSVIPVVTIGKLANNALNQFNLVNDLTFVARTHTLKFGADYRRVQSVYNDAGSPLLYNLFYNFSSFGAGAAKPAVGTVLSGVTSNTFVLSASRGRIPLLFENFSAYAQDTWRVNNRLTLTYGVRYEVNPPLRGIEGANLFTLDQTDNYQTALLAPAGTPLFAATYNNFAPRVGAAYQIFNKPGREAVLRGGFGVFYDTAGGRFAAAAFGFPNNLARRTFNTPFTQTGAVVQPISAVNLADPYPVAEITTADRHLKLPYTNQFNLAVEQSLGKNQILRIAYVGALGRRLLRNERFQANFNPRFTSIITTKNSAESSYNALQAQYTRRLSDNLQALVTYTWAHSIDTVSNDSVQNNTPDFISDPNIDRGDSDFDIRHSFNAAITYNLPTPKTVKIIFGGFALDAIFTARSAPPVNLVGRTINNPITVNLRPDTVAGQPLYLADDNAPGGRRFNPAAFKQPPVGANDTFLRQGTLGRNALRGFSLYQTDLAIRRQFNLIERFKLELRAEAFNVFNRPNFAAPVEDINNGLFGLSTQLYGRGLSSGGGPTGGFNPLYQIGGPRSIQLAVKITF